MKKISSLLFLLAVATVFSITSCNKCKDVECLNGGTCNEDDGLCECLTGYEGTDCGTEIRAKFLGIFEGNESCTQTGSGSLTFTVSESTADIMELKISGSWSTFLNPIYATVSGNDFTIASQDPDNNGKTISGSGTITADQTKISVDYTVTDTGANVCSATLTKQ